MASPIRRTGPCTCPIRCRARRWRSSRLPAIRTAGICCASRRASPERIQPVCPHFGVCGGCQTQHWDFAPYRDWKRGLVVEALRQAGLDAPVGDLIDAHGEGRRRAVFHARAASHGVLEVGFAAWRAHQIVGIDRCPVLAPSLHGALPAAWAIAEAIGPGKPLDIQVTATDAGLDVDVRGSGPLGARHTAALARLAETHRLARLTRHGELIVQRAAPTVRMGKATVALPPGAFLQATAEGEAILARLVSEHVGKAKTVADLFCGVGPFALRLAERARVTAADCRRGRHRGAPPGGKNARPQADCGRSARSVSPPARPG